MNNKFLNMIQSYETLVDKRQDLMKRVDEMSASTYDDHHGNGTIDLSQDDDDDEDDFLEEQELTAQEQRLANLRHRRAELEDELDQIRTETHQKQALLSKQPLRVASPTALADLELDKRKIAEMQEMKEWYDTLRDILEELSGMKIIGVDSIGEQMVNMKVMLLEEHQVMIGLKAVSRNTLSVASAKFLTSANVSVDQSLELSIPGLDDLVQICSTLGPVDDLRFLLREIMARIRIHKARVQELTVLRKEYLTKIGKLYHSVDSFGGRDQEIVCSLPEGVTVVLRLTPDCPMVPGSVKVDQIVGIGGWDEGLIESLKVAVNVSMCRGPRDMMKVLVAEIQRLQADGMELPKTPTLPQRSK